MASIDSFSRYTQQYDSRDLLLASNMRNNLKLPPPFEVSKRKDGTIRLEKVLPKFELSTGIQAGYQLLQLQGKDVSEYRGGIEAIRKVLQQNRRIELIALKPSPGQKTGDEKKTKNKKASTVSVQQAFETQVLQSLPKKSKKKVKKRDKAAKKNLQELRKNHNYGDLLWAVGKKRSLQHSAPFRLRQFKSGAILMHYVEPEFQKATGIQRGHRLVQLQGKDIQSYENFAEIQKVVQESLELHVVVLKQMPPKRTKNPTDTTPEPFETTKKPARSKRRSVAKDEKSNTPSRSAEASSSKRSSSKRKPFSFSSKSSGISLSSGRSSGRFGWLKSKLFSKRDS